MTRITALTCLLVVMMFAAIPSIAQPPDTLWTKTFGGIGGERGDCVQLTDDGGYINTGDTYSLLEAII
ncbi:MAG TPA: hypothetical protein ENH10_02055 [Bacteroidetes bacterium]|nr:hypothetical protein BMS3Bbin04_01376 [bacterium BMS3Bbin04]HDO64799.1 hypothetical protein [Bacteroidota bacterium]HEX03924.1 hypothetical protein [Bacteroidota bacterium]